MGTGTYSYIRGGGNVARGHQLAACCENSPPTHKPKTCCLAPYLPKRVGLGNRLNNLLRGRGVGGGNKAIFKVIDIESCLKITYQCRFIIYLFEIILMAFQVELSMRALHCFSLSDNCWKENYLPLKGDLFFSLCFRNTSFYVVLVWLSVKQVSLILVLFRMFY
jgi:hypothetical protein